MWSISRFVRYQKRVKVEENGCFFGKNRGEVEGDCLLKLIGSKIIVGVENEVLSPTAKYQTCCRSLTYPPIRLANKPFLALFLY